MKFRTWQPSSENELKNTISPNPKKDAIKKPSIGSSAVIIIPPNVKVKHTRPSRIVLAILGRDIFFSSVINLVYKVLGVNGHLC